MTDQPTNQQVPPPANDSKVAAFIKKNAVYIAGVVLGAIIIAAVMTHYAS